MPVLDLRSSYSPVPVRKEYGAKTAFVTPFGFFLFLVMPFAIRKAGNTIQRLVDRIRARLSNKKMPAYQDDCARI